MKTFLAIVVPMVLCATTIVRGAQSDFTVEWTQNVAPGEQNVELMTIGDSRISLRTVPPKKQNDAPRCGLFMNDTLVTSTALYPNRPYELAIARSGEKLQYFVNGSLDVAPPTTVRGNVAAKLDNMKVTDKALSAEEILAHFKAKLKPREVTTVAHRGIHKHAPENTRISYVQALEAGAPILELDTALSKDNQIVLMHDKTVDRTTDGTGAVAQLTLEQLKKLDAGSWKDPKYKGEPVPTLDDIAKIARDKAILMLDLKAIGQGKAISEWLASSRYPKDQVLLAPWEDAEGVALRRYLPDIAMIRLTSKIPTENYDDAYFEGMKKIGFSGFSVNWQHLTPAFVDAAHKHGMKIYTWTLNDLPEIAGALAAGVDGVITDDSGPTKKFIADLMGR